MLNYNNNSKEIRKKVEIEYYDKKAEKQLRKGFGERDFEGFNLKLLSSFKFCYKILRIAKIKLF